MAIEVLYDLWQEIRALNYHKLPEVLQRTFGNRNMNKNLRYHYSMKGFCRESPPEYVLFDIGYGSNLGTFNNIQQSDG